MVHIVGHKGVGYCEIENTIPAFLRAIEIGCQRTELDVRLSRDGKCVVFHDRDVSATTNGGGNIDQISYRQIRDLRLNDTDAPIPTLQEVIDVCKGKISLQIELKAEGTPKVVCSLLKENGLISSTRITSFETDLLSEVKYINPKIEVGLLISSQEVLRRIGWYISYIPLEYIGPHEDLVTSELIDKMHTKGVKIYAYRVNDKKRGEELIEMGVDDIGTDKPHFFL